MYRALIFCHNCVRWLVLASLLYAIYRAYRGYFSRSAFTKTDNAARHWTATMAQVQMLIGMVLYFKSPAINYFWANFKKASKNLDVAFFGLIHISLMLTAVVLITTGSAMAKRQQGDREKFRTMLILYSMSLIIIFLAIPWPFSPFANRPYFR